MSLYQEDHDHGFKPECSIIKLFFYHLNARLLVQYSDPHYTWQRWPHLHCFWCKNRFRSSSKDPSLDPSIRRTKSCRFTTWKKGIFQLDNPNKTNFHTGSRIFLKLWLQGALLNSQDSTIQDAQRVARASVGLAQGMIGRERLRYLV